MLDTDITDTMDTTHHTSALGDHREGQPTSHRIMMALQISLMFTTTMLRMGVLKALLILARHRRVLGPMGPVDIFGSQRCQPRNHPLDSAIKPCSRVLNKSPRLKTLAPQGQAHHKCPKVSRLRRHRPENQYRSALHRRQRHSRKNKRKRKGGAGSRGKAAKAKGFGA